MEHVSAAAQFFDVTGDSGTGCGVLLQRPRHHGAGAVHHVRLCCLPALDRPTGGAGRRSRVRLLPLHGLPVGGPPGPGPHHERALGAHRPRPPLGRAGRQGVAGRLVPGPAGVGAARDRGGGTGHRGGHGCHRPGGPVGDCPPGGGEALCLRPAGLGGGRRAVRRALGPLPGRPVLRAVPGPRRAPPQCLRERLLELLRPHQPDPARPGLRPTRQRPFHR